MNGVSIKEISAVTNEVTKELARALKIHPPMNSAHEGWAVLLEEVDELWDEIKLRPSLRDKQRMREEAVQVAAMAMRFLLEVAK